MTAEQLGGQQIISCAVIAVAGETVKLPHNDHVEQLLVAVFDHVLKFGAIVRFYRNGSVDVVAKNRDTILLGKGRTLSNLTLDAFFSLAV